MSVQKIRPAVRSGEFRKRIDIQQSTAVSDTEGNPGVTWATFASSWAAIEPLVGTESMTAGQMQYQVSHLVRMRYQAGITTDMRVHETAKNLYLDIQAVIDIDDVGRQLHLMCNARRYEAI